MSRVRKSNIRTETRITEAGRRLAAAEFPSGRLVCFDRGTLVFYLEADDCPAERDAFTEPANTRTGVLYRREDATGVSGTGVVADFIEFTDGSVVQEWRNEDNENLKVTHPRGSGLDYRPSMEMAVAIHGHDGRTEYVYDNGDIAGT